MSKKQIRMSYAARLKGGAAVAALLALPADALAQEPVETVNQQDAEAAPAQQMETIQVTGSLLQRDPNLTAPVPVQSLGEEELQLSGEINLAEVVGKIPALLSSVSGENSTTGQSSLNLRGLGSARTLTLVNGRRHVAGFEGSQAVDIGSIPRPLVERVEVFTGGASAIYGSDAVTGVVNFILKDDFEGFNVDARLGSSTRWDAENASLQFTAGRNFAQDRGNIVFTADFSADSRLTYGDRPWSRNNGVASDDVNPALRFQDGEISGSSTPNFFEFYNFENTGRYPYGFNIPSQADFAAAYEAEFGAPPSFSDAELALFERAANAPSRLIAGQHTFSISS